MGEPAVGFLVALLVVVGVLVSFGAIPWFGMRAAFHPPTPWKRRRLAQSLVAFGFFALGLHVGAVVYGAEIRGLQLLGAIAPIA